MSAAIRDFSYDQDRTELTVTFATGKVYVYALVPPGVAAAFAEAGSKGAFHNAHIRERYPFRKTPVGRSAPANGATLMQALKASREGDD